MPRGACRARRKADPDAFLARVDSPSTASMTARWTRLDPEPAVHYLGGPLGRPPVSLRALPLLLLAVLVLLAGPAAATTESAGVSPATGADALPAAPDPDAVRDRMADLALGLAPACDAEGPAPAEAWLDRITTGWRPLSPMERRNAGVIYRSFREAGHTHGLAFAAIVNAWAESALDHRAVMRQPFRWRDPRNPSRTKYYPRGTGAVGLFQLLPSVSGAGGPSGLAEGYGRPFRDRRWAGTTWQARRHGTTPDWRGRTYYDAMDPQVNTERILLEVERDGARVVAAAERGLPIAVLADLFGRYIERPQSSTRPRRRLAARMLGGQLAWTPNPDGLFADAVDPHVDLAATEALTCDRPLPFVRATHVAASAATATAPAPATAPWSALVSGSLIATLPGLGLLLQPG